MSMFFDNHVLMDGEQALQSAWSNNDFNMMLAVATSAPRIIFISEEGAVVPNFEIARKKCAVSSLKWHPLMQALAIGWEDGFMTLWNEDERLTRDDKTVHHSAVTNITFSTDGSRMVTGDVKGTCAVWRTHKGMTPLCQYTREGAIFQIVFCSLVLNQQIQNNADSSNSLFFFGGQSGSVCLADDLKNCSEVCKVPGSVKSILFYEKENSVIIITSHLLLVQFKLNLAEKLVPDRKVKLAVAGNPEFLNTIWAGQGLMATCSGENMIRMFSIQSDENYVLTLAEPAFQGHIYQDKINCISYNAKNRILAGGTKNGYIVMWKCKQMTVTSPDSSEGWEARTPIKTQGPGITQVQWGGNSNVISALYPTGATVLTHTILKKKMKDDFKMIQVSNRAVEVRVRHENANNSDYQIMMTLSMNIKGIDCCNSHTLFWNGKFAQVYDVNAHQGAQLLGNFESRSNVCALTLDSVVQSPEAGKLEVCSYSGEVKQVLPFTEQEGEVIKIDARGKYMAVITSKQMIKMFDVSRRTYKQLGVTRKFEIRNGETIGEIKDIALNADGKKLAILCDQCPFQSIRIPDQKFYVYDIDMDKFLEQKVAPNRVPIECFWDQHDARLLAIETEFAMTEDANNLNDSNALGNSPVKGLNERTVAEIDADFEQFKKEDQFTGKTCETYFVTSDYGIKKQDSVKFETCEETVLGIQVPFFYYMGRKMTERNDDDSDEDQNQKPSDSDQNLLIIRKPMKDFVGLENVDENIRKAIMNFSHFLSVGNMDEAYNSVRNIKNQTVWQNMAQMCVKTKRMDVALVCLGNMRFARGAKAARETVNEKELDARLAMVAIQLNMLDDAKELYKSCGRYDLLCKLYQSCGEWDEAIAIASKYNRINLKNTHFQYAKHLETIGNIDMAIKHYIESGTHRNEVPRMLTMLNMPERLQEFVNAQRDPALYKWWAQYLEGQGMIQEALQMYREAHDYGSCVRLFCAVGDMQAATKIAMQSSDPQACFTIAKFLQDEGNIADAILYYSKSGRLAHAIRLAKENNFDQQVMTMSLMSSKQIMIQSAQYFEQKGKYDKCVQLYSRGGNKRKAMDLALAHNLGHLIEDVASGVGDGDDPEVLKSSVSFLMQNQQYEKAIEIMIGLGQLDEALSITEQHNVTLKEEQVTKLIPPPTDNPNHKKERIDILLRLAKLVKKQGQFKLGAKIYTMANEKMKGIKCLLKSADVKAVISFATNARDTQVYVLAGNFLQNQNWHNDPEIMKTIISFYSKAKAFENLANFYDACAQVEIDEYRDYEKALGAMKEAKRQLDKSNGVNKDIKQSQLNKRIRYLEMFCEAREAVQNGNGDQMVEICDQLISSPQVEEAIRLGDVFAQLIEHTFYKQQNVQAAYGYLEKMKQKNIIITPYLDSAMVEKIYRGMGMQVPTDRPQKNTYGGDDIDEEIPEDF